MHLIDFSQTLQCELCSRTRELLQQLVPFLDKFLVEVYNFQLDTKKLARSRIDKVFATAIDGEKAMLGRSQEGCPSVCAFITFVSYERRFRSDSPFAPVNHPASDLQAVARSNSASESHGQLNGECLPTTRNNSLGHRFVQDGANNSSVNYSFKTLPSSRRSPRSGRTV